MRLEVLGTGHVNGNGAALCSVDLLNEYRGLFGSGLGFAAWVLWLVGSKLRGRSVSVSTWLAVVDFGCSEPSGLVLGTVNCLKGRVGGCLEREGALVVSNGLGLSPIGWEYEKA